MGSQHYTTVSLRLHLGLMSKNYKQLQSKTQQRKLEFNLLYGENFYVTLENMVNTSIIIFYITVKEKDTHVFSLLPVVGKRKHVWDEMSHLTIKWHRQRQRQAVEVGLQRRGWGTDPAPLEPALTLIFSLISGKKSPRGLILWIRHHLPLLLGLHCHKPKGDPKSSRQNPSSSASTPPWKGVKTEKPSLLCSHTHHYHAYHATDYQNYFIMTFIAPSSALTEAQGPQVISNSHTVLWELRQLQSHQELPILRIRFTPSRTACKYLMHYEFCYLFASSITMSVPWGHGLLSLFLTALPPAQWEHSVFI